MAGLTPAQYEEALRDARVRLDDRQQRLDKAEAERDNYRDALTIIAGGSATGDPVALAKEVLALWQW